MLLYIYLIIAIIFFFKLNNDSTNPVWVDIILSILWLLLATIILMAFIGLIIYNLIFELKNKS